MTKLVSALASIQKLLKDYPALSAALVNVGVVLAAYFGLHITADQLVGFVAVANVLFGIIVHSNVTPVNKLNSVLQIAIDRGVPVGDFQQKAIPVGNHNPEPVYPKSYQEPYRPVSEETQMMPVVKDENVSSSHGLSSSPSTGNMSGSENPSATTIAPSLASYPARDGGWHD